MNVEAPRRIIGGNANGGVEDMVGDGSAGAHERPAIGESNAIPGKAGSSIERLTGLLGDPVAHSLSPAMHNAAFAELGVGCRYIAFRVAAEDFDAAMEGLRALGAIGVNITVPHKERAFRWVRRLDSSAKRTGAVNTVLFRGEEAGGYNTDVAGARAAIRSLAPRRGQALVLGAGGAARAAICALLDEGFERIVLSNRSRERATKLLDDLAGSDGSSRLAELKILPWGSTPGAAPDLTVNATSLGLDGTPWPEGFLDGVLKAGSGAVLDLVYSREGDTPLCSEAKKRGIPSASGIEMLLQQGAEAFTIFTGLPAPVDAMRGALELRSE